MPSKKKRASASKSDERPTEAKRRKLEEATAAKESKLETLQQYKDMAGQLRILSVKMTQASNSG
jgi:hypothetical protein